MSEDLTVSSGWMVDTEYLTRAALTLARWSALLQELRGRLQFAAREHETQYMLGTPIGHRADRTADQAIADLERAITEVSQLGIALQLAARGYDLTEQTAARIAEAAAAMQAMLLIGGGMATVVGLLPLIGITLGARAAAGRPVELRDIAALLRRSGILSDPRTVAAARAVVSGADETILAVIGVPPPIAVALGDSGLGLVTTEGAAAAVLGVSGAGAPVVRVRAATVPAAPAPTGFGDLAARVPYGKPGQVRVERYVTEGGARYVVYVDGTRDAGLGTTAEPFDMASNLAGVAGVDGAATTSTEEAMRLAGIGPGDPVLFAGYSQGGLVAARLAQSGDYSTVGLVTFGSPIGQLDLPSDVPVVSLEHREDLVPALGGVDGTGAAVGKVTVSRSLYDGAPPDDWVPAHQIDAYRQTAALVDGSTDPRLATMRTVLSQFTGAATTTEYTARRAGQ